MPCDCVFYCIDQKLLSRTDQDVCLHKGPHHQKGHGKRAKAAVLGKILRKPPAMLESNCSTVARDGAEIITLNFAAIF